MSEPTGHRIGVLDHYSDDKLDKPFDEYNSSLPTDVIPDKFSDEPSTPPPTNTTERHPVDKPSILWIWVIVAVVTTTILIIVIAVGISCYRKTGRDNFEDITTPPPGIHFQKRLLLIELNRGLGLYQGIDLNGVEKYFMYNRDDSEWEVRVLASGGKVSLETVSQTARNVNESNVINKFGAVITDLQRLSVTACKCKAIRVL